MGRASKQQAELNRKRVVESAARLYRARGADTVSIADVMEAADLTPGGFYKQFGSRERLDAEAFLHAFDQSSDSWTFVRSRAASNESSGLTALMKHYFKRRTPEQVCPILAFAQPVTHQTVGEDAQCEYERGTESLFEQFREESNIECEKLGLEPLTDDHVNLLFAAMVGVGMLTRTLGDTVRTRALQAAALNALPHPPTKTNSK